MSLEDITSTEGKYTPQEFADYLQGHRSKFLDCVKTQIYEPFLLKVKDLTLREALDKTRRIRVTKVVGSNRHRKGTCPVTGYKRQLTDQVKIQNNKRVVLCSKEGGRVVRAIVAMRSFLLRHKDTHHNLDDTQFLALHKQFTRIRNNLYIDPKQ